MTLRGFAVRDELVAGFAAALAGEHLALRLQAVGLGVNAVVPVVTQRFADFLNLAIRVVVTWRVNHHALHNRPRNAM